ncbi:hypothetical protein F939_01860 [Acinetobacter radioresistens DSM 6976 = NBRC 102413 = CIP 103788]|nr:hypothetical protein F939_01860 [Acinetobacter radioresistens DSM 6976 = NBRC 102413 = CIP 103788]
MPSLISIIFIIIAYIIYRYCLNNPTNGIVEYCAYLFLIILFAISTRSTDFLFKVLHSH